MTNVLLSLADHCDDRATVALAYALAVQTGMIRTSPSVEELKSSFTRLPAEARHGLRELAQAYVRVVREADKEQEVANG